ncbi:MAG TPA: hypothetical protein VGG44_02595 [Tepidisphaeraceae bacterium]|jgi:hypothetical protein
MNASLRNILMAPLLGAILIALTMLAAGCEVRAEGPPGVVIGPPQIDLVDVNGYHHHGYYDDHHAWHGGWEDEHHVHHDDPGDWHR